MQKDIYIVGIAGRSCSGKSTLARELHENFGSASIHINVDKFFIRSAEFNCKNPTIEESSAIKEISTKLRKLKNGGSVDFSIFDCRKKRNLNMEPRHYDPAKFIIVEGTLVLWDKEMRDLIDLKVFVDVPNEVCLQRRLERELKNKQEGTAVYEEAKKHVLDRWKIIFEQWDSYLQSTSVYANITIPHLERGFNKVLSAINNLQAI